MRVRLGVGAGDFPVDEGVDDKGRDETHVEDIAAEGQQAAVGEEKGLHDQDRGDGEKGGMGAEQDRQQQPAAQMAAGAGRRNGEIDHLGGKEEGAEHPHERHLAVVQLLPHLLRAVGDGAGRGRPHGAADSGR